MDKEDYLKEKYEFDAKQEKYQMWKEEQYWAKSDYCEKCLEHDENCPFYDPEEESWDFEECYEVMGWD